KQSKN
ncbi:hypothetical protein ACTFIW_005900, partial [Dictyostelium discoideum]